LYKRDSYIIKIIAINSFLFIQIVQEEEEKNVQELKVSAQKVHLSLIRINKSVSGQELVTAA
jgi:hypothetical protein